MKCKICRVSVFIFLFCSLCLFAFPEKIIIDHNCTDLSKIPVNYINLAKQNFKVYYNHTSHGSQIISGIAEFNASPFNYIENGVQEGALSITNLWESDLGHNGDLAWRDTTVALLNTSGNDRNFIMWSWCGGVSDNTEEGINTYLNAMNQLETNYPNVKFVYMTGHLDGTGAEGDLHKYNNQIRNYCNNNNKILFDFADIESYDPNGKYVLPLYANDNCDYWEGGEQKNWATEWCEANPGKCSSCECAHSQSLNCDRKGRAFWWMMARAAGWDGSTTATLTPTPTPTPTPSLTNTPTPTSSPSPTPDITASPTPTPEVTIPPTATPTPSKTAIPTATPTATPIISPSPTPVETITPTPSPSPTSSFTPTPTKTPSSNDPALSEILRGCKYLTDGDIPIDTFMPPPNALYVASSGGSDSNTGTIDSPFATLDRAIIVANENSQTAYTIYLRNGIHLYKGTNEAEYLTIDRGNLYITSYPGEKATIRPYIYPQNPTNWGIEHAFEFAGGYQNITFDNLNFEGWSVIFTLGSPPNMQPLINICIKNITASDFKQRNGSTDFLRVFLETVYLDSDVYGEGKQIFDNPDNARYQIEGLIISNVTVNGVDLGVNIGDENDANVKGFRISHFNLINPVLPPGGSANDAIAIVNSYKILIDYCNIKNVNDDGIDTKSYDAAVVNCYVEGTGRNAVKFWRNGEMINSILYKVTEIDDGAIVIKDGPFRMINSVLLKHTAGYAGTFSYETPTTESLEIVNSVFGEVQGFFVNTTNFRAMNNRYFDILNDSSIYSGLINAQNATELNTITNCSGNAMSTNQFINPSAGDFNLINGSEWINNGTTSYSPLPSYDYYGNPRVVGSGIDIGPIEKQGYKNPKLIILH